MVVFSVKPLFTIFVVSLTLLVVFTLLSPRYPFSQNWISGEPSLGEVDIWSVRRLMEWRPCKWWLQGHQTALPLETNGYIRVDCYGGLNQMRRDFEVASYWNETSGFADVYDLDYFIQQMNGFVKVVKTLPPDIATKEPVQVDCSKRKGQFDYVESVLPSLLKGKEN
ncbi:unnamed protein product [Vicia faba]|uniref:O-fucosyltransferase family protein n=1 Tax=Vicia faba TaxID=3906 RepID=A0AAV0ZUY4_VICFA|nr:unnamed protein product [Vicia faba]